MSVFLNAKVRDEGETDLCYDEFVKVLNSEQIELFERFLDAREGGVLRQIEHTLVEGFKLGVRIGVECMED